MLTGLTPLKDMKRHISFTLFFVVFVFCPGYGLAQEQAPAEQAILEIKAGVKEAASGVLKEFSTDGVNEIPSYFNLILRGIKERVSIIATLDPIEKARKQLNYAEESMKIAGLIAEKSTEEKILNRAQYMARRANQLMEQIEKKKDKWSVKNAEQAKELLKNITNYQASKEGILSRMESKFSGEQLEKFKTLRKHAEDIGKRLLNTLNKEAAKDNADSETTKKIGQEKKDGQEAMKQGAYESGKRMAEMFKRFMDKFKQMMSKDAPEESEADK